jgi:cytidyltransferase-like protein
MKSSILSTKVLFKITSDLKKKNKEIVLTHGAFDLFHHGHLDLLEKSKSIADYLIVGIECDKNISKYKDYRRPIINEKSRATIASAIYCTDAVFINNEEVEEDTY